MHTESFTAFAADDEARTAAIEVIIGDKKFATDELREAAENCAGRIVDLERRGRTIKAEALRRNARKFYGIG